MSTDYTASRDERLVIMYSRTPKVLGGIQYTMNSRKTQVNKKLKSLNNRINNINKRLTNNAPVAISSRKGDAGKDYYRTAGRERISSVTALNSSFDIKDVFINPANQGLFPWLSGIGKKYDLYRFKRLKFSYVPALPTSEEGNVYLGLDYNTLDPAPASSTELCQLSHWTMNVVWKPNTLVIDINNIGWLYTRSGPVANADYKTYDLGKLFVAVEGITYTGTVGYVEVDYDVEFKRRQPDYTQQVIPTTDILTPFAFIDINALAYGTSSTSFDTESFSNNSIISLNNSTGTFTVSKGIDAIVQFSANNGSGLVTTISDSAGPTLMVSTDNVTYSAITGNTFTKLVNFVPGRYYKIHNNTNATLHVATILSIIHIED